MGSGSSAKILRFSYDASGNVVAVDYSTDNGSTFNTYYYLRNAQNDIVKLIDNSCSGFVNEFDDIAPGIAETVFDGHWFFHHRTQLISEGVSSSLKSLLFVFRLLSQS